MSDNTQFNVPSGIAERIRKLQALADKAGTEAEAAAAAARVAELCRKYNLEIGVIMLEQQETKASEAFHFHDGVFEAHRSYFGEVCNLLFDVKNYRRHTKGVKRKNGWQVVFYGLKANVEAATITYSYLHESVEAMMMGAWREGRIRGIRADCRSFRLGCGTRLLKAAQEHAQLAKAAIQGSTECQALVHLGNKLILQHEARLHLAKPTKVAGSASPDAWTVGYAAGGRIDLHGARSNRMLKGAK